jgi:hypothetical protein
MRGRLVPEERQYIERHIASCNRCLGELVIAREAIRRERGLIRNVERAARKLLGCSESKWLVLSILLFFFSFVYRRYFLQFLAAAVILGVKWVMEGEGARKTIMIFRDLEKKVKKNERKTPPRVSNMAGGDENGKGRQWSRGLEDEED